jgi:hypothetical protein
MGAICWVIAKRLCIWAEWFYPSVICQLHEVIHADEVGDEAQKVANGKESLDV